MSTIFLLLSVFAIFRPFASSDFFTVPPLFGVIIAVSDFFALAGIVSSSPVAPVVPVFVSVRRMIPASVSVSPVNGTVSFPVRFLVPPVPFGTSLSRVFAMPGLVSVFLLATLAAVVSWSRICRHLAISRPISTEVLLVVGPVRSAPRLGFVAALADDFQPALAFPAKLGNALREVDVNAAVVDQDVVHLTDEKVLGQIGRPLTRTEK